MSRYTKSVAQPMYHRAVTGVGEAVSERSLREWVFNECGITAEGAWTQEFDRLLAATLDAATAAPAGLDAEVDEVLAFGTSAEIRDLVARLIGEAYAKGLAESREGKKA